MRALVTSRARLRLRGEQEYPVLPLALPDEREGYDVRQLLATPAGALFVERARAVQPDFRATPANAAYIAAICVRLDGLPLAIELAAARSKALTPLAMLPRLEQRLTFLTGGAQDSPARQQTLRDTLGWSYALLTPNEQRLFRALSVCVGGWTLDTAEALAADLGPNDVFDLLDALIDKSLVRRSEQPDGEPRYTQLETIRELGQTQLIAAGEERAVRQAHAIHVLDLVRRAGTGLEGPEQITWLDRLERDHANIRAALDWFAAQRDAEHGWTMLLPLWLFWWMRGHLTEARAHCERLLALPDDGAQPLTRAQALTGAGIILRWLNLPEQSRAWQDEALSIYWGLPLAHRRNACWSLLCLGDLARQEGDHAGAAARYAEALRLARALDDRYMISFGLLTTGVSLADRGDIDRASEAWSASAELCRSIDNTLGLAMSLANLGNMLLLRDGRGDDRARARVLHEESAALMRDMGHQRMLAKSLAHLGWIAIRDGRLAAARDHFDEAMPMSRDIGDLVDVAYAQLGLGEIARRSRALDDAERQLRAAIATVQPLADVLAHDVIAGALESLAAVARDGGQAERAARLAGAAAAVREAADLPLAGVDKDKSEDLVAGIAFALGEAAFTAHWATGHALGIDAATDEACAT